MHSQVFTTGARVGFKANIMPCRSSVSRCASARRVMPVVKAAAATDKEMKDDLGFKLMRAGVKEAAAESILTPR